MHLKIFSPGKVTPCVANDNETNEALYNMLYTAATKEQENGKSISKKDRGERMGGNDSK